MILLDFRCSLQAKGPRQLGSSIKRIVYNLLCELEGMCVQGHRLGLDGEFPDHAGAVALSILPQGPPKCTRLHDTALVRPRCSLPLPLLPWAASLGTCMHTPGSSLTVDERE